MDDGSIWRCIASVMPSISPAAGEALGKIGEKADYRVIIIYACFLVLFLAISSYFASAEIALASLTALE